MYKNLPEMLDAACKRYWWRKAILAEDRTTRYFSLSRHVNKTANVLVSKLGVQAGEKICILLGNSGLYPVVFFSILKAGAVAVPLNIFLKGEELKYIINQCDARLLFTSQEFYPTVKEIRPALTNITNIILVDADTGNNKSRLLAPKVLALSGLRRYAPRNDKRRGETVAGTQEYISLTEQIKGVSAKSPKIDIHPHSVAVIIYTSGTTGFPKGAMLTHENLLSNIESGLEASRINKKDRLLVVLPLFHSFTMTVCMLVPLSTGGGMVIAASLAPFKKVFRRVLFCGVTIIAGIPSLFILLAKAKIPWIIRKLLRIRLCVSGAAPLPTDTLEKFEKNWRIPLVEGYGLSEASPIVSLNPLEGKRKPGSVGLPIKDVSVKIAGPDEEELPAGEVGEIIVKGSNVMKGYYKNEEATKETIRGEWLFTGDMGRIDEDGYIYIVDRKKDMILVRGLNVYPREVEQVLSSHPGVLDAAVVGRPDRNRGEVPVAFIIPKEGIKLNHIEMIKYCRERLAFYKVPRQIFIRETLPRTPTGKILKRELRRSLTAE